MRSTRILLVISLLLAPLVLPANAQVTHLVKDITTVPLPMGPTVGPPLTIGSTTYFLAYAFHSGLSMSLWKTDGTSLGTVRIKGFENMGSSLLLAEYNGSLFLSGSEGSFGYELWKSDGTAEGTVRVADIHPGADGSGIRSMLACGTALFFGADDGIHGRELYRTDGTESGTVLVADISPGKDSSSPENFACLNGLLLFSATDGASGNELWRSDGTAAGTVIVKDILPGAGDSSPSDPVSTSGKVFFSATDGIHGRELWVTDGTESGTFMTADATPGASDCLYAFTTFNGQAYFGGCNGTSYQLWTSDGTTPGTLPVVSLPGLPGGFAELDGALYFTNVASLWKTDGTAEGTILISAVKMPCCLTAADNLLYFRGFDDSIGYELWRSDGTTSGTMPVKDILPGPDGSYPSNLSASGNVLLFQADDGTLGRQLWRSDGTENGTTILVTLDTPMSDTYMGSTADVDGTFFFTEGPRLWKSDGTTDGTLIVKEFASEQNFGELTAFDGGLIFIADDGTTGAELWRSDGTPGGTTLLKDINPVGSSMLYPGMLSRLVPFNGLLYFPAYDGDSLSLWRTDGSEAGTVPVSTLLTGTDGDARGMAAMNGTLYFPVCVSGACELWKSDGTQSGTVAVGGLPESYIGYDFIVAGSRFFFRVGHSDLGIELWRSDGTPEGTYLLMLLSNNGRRVRNLRVPAIYNDTAFFIAEDEAHGAELWKSDGTPEGTQIVKDIFPGAGDSRPIPFSIQNNLLFVATDPDHGRELWKSDGTEDGTVLVKDMVPGQDGLFAFFFYPGTAGGVTYFQGSNGTSGFELWRTDGTTSGTYLVADIWPGPASSLPYGFWHSGNLTYFSASDPEHGRELWALQDCYFCDDFADGDFTAPPWNPVPPSAWQIVDGRLTGTTTRKATAWTPPFVAPATRNVEAKVTIEAGARVSLFGWYENRGQNVELRWLGERNRMALIQRSGYGTVRKSLRMPISPGESFEARIQFDGVDFRVYLNGASDPALTLRAVSQPAGFAAFRVKSTARGPATGALDYLRIY